MYDLPLRRIEWHSDSIYSLFLERGGLSFVPGDCLALYAADGTTSRPYSIASGTADEELEFLIRKIPGGALSDWLSEREVGEAVKVSPPFGWFRPGDVDEGVPFVFFATGTGVSPFLSHLRSRDTVPAQLFYGAREDADLLPLPEGLPSVMTAVSRTADTQHHSGRITDLLAQVEVDPATHYYACGLDAMIEEVAAFLEEVGVPLHHIHRECFFNAQELPS